MIKEVTIFIVISLICGQLAWSGRIEAEQHLKEGNQYFEAGNCQRALSEYRAYLRCDSSDKVVAYYNMGLIYEYLNQLELAKMMFRQCLIIDSGKAAVYQALGDVLTKQADYEGAVKEYQTALKLDPHGATVYVSCGYALYMTGDRTGAIENYRMALKKDSSFIEAKFRLGQILAENQDSVKVAEELFKEVIQADPNHAPCYLCWSNVCEIKGEISRSIKMMRKAIEIEPANAFYHYRLAELLLMPSVSRDINKAEEEFGIANQLDPKNYPKPKIVRRSPNDPSF